MREAERTIATMEAAVESATEEKDMYYGGGLEARLRSYTVPGDTGIT